MTIKQAFADTKLLKLNLGISIGYAFLCAFFMTACGPGDDDKGNVLLEDANNYSFVGDLHIPPIETVAGTDAEDVVIDWTELTVDLQNHDMDPSKDIDSIQIIRFSYKDLTEEKVQAALSNGTLPMKYSNGSISVNNPKGTTVTIGDMKSTGGKKIDLAEEYTEDQRIYLLIIATGITPGHGARMLMFLRPRNDSTNKLVEVTNKKILEFSADLTSLTPAQIPGEGPWVMDWSGLTKNGQDVDLVPGKNGIDGVMLGFYEKETVESLQKKVLDLELIATNLWQQPLKEVVSTFDLAELEGFTGFSGNGVWLFGLTCSSCSNPAPLFLTVLEPI